MNVLICTEFYDPQIGGVEEHSRQLSNYFHKLGYHVELVTTFNKNRKTKNNLIKVNQFKIKGNFVKGYSGETINYQNFLLKNKFDIIFINAAQQWTCDLLLPIIKNIKAKKIFFPCGFSRLNNIFYIPYFNLLKQLINNFTAIICVSRNFQDYKFIKKFYKKKIYIIENGASIIKPIYSKDEFKKKYNINKYDKIICNISNIKFLKGQDKIISILRKIKKKNIKLFLIGKNMSPFYYLYIKLMVFLFNKNQNEKKIILISPKRVEALTILKYSDIFLFGSRIEYDPLVIKEAILASKKFISYDVGIVNKYAKLGFGFCSKNKKIIITKLEKFLENGHASYKPNKINIYNWDNILVKYAKIFQRL
jgi:glycosyltransferase involved in cell wall biosynthesis